MTLTYKLDLNISNICLYTKHEVSKLRLSKLIEQTNITPYIGLTVVSYVGGPPANIHDDLVALQ